MKRILVLLAVLTLFLGSSFAQIQQSGAVVTPSATQSILGGVNVAMTNATCNVLTPGSACTLSGISQSYLVSYYLTYNITSATSAQSLVIPLQPGAEHWVNNTSSFVITAGGATGTTVAVQPGTDVLINCPDGSNYVTGGGIGGSGTVGFMPIWTGTTVLGNGPIDLGETTPSVLTIQAPTDDTIEVISTGTGGTSIIGGNTAELASLAGPVNIVGAAAVNVTTGGSSNTMSFPTPGIAGTVGILEGTVGDSQCVHTDSSGIGLLTAGADCAIGSGTANTIPLWAGTSTLGDSPLSVSNSPTTNGVFDSGTFYGEDVCWHYESGNTPLTACLRYAGHGNYYGPYNTNNGTTFTPTPFSVGQLNIGQAGATGVNGQAQAPSVYFYENDTAATGPVAPVMGTIAMYQSQPTGACPNAGISGAVPVWGFAPDKTLSFCTNAGSSTWSAFSSSGGSSVLLSPPSNADQTVTGKVITYNSPNFWVGLKSMFGAVGNGQYANDCSWTAASTTVTCASAHFVSGDVGKTISLPYGGAAHGSSAGSNYGQALVTTIAAVVSSTQITITASTVSAVDGPKTMTGCTPLITGNNLITCTGGATLNAGDIGKGFLLNGAGPGVSGSLDFNLPERITGTPSTLSLNVLVYPIQAPGAISITLPGGAIVWGADDTTKIQTAVSYGCANGVGLEIEQGYYLFTSQITGCTGMFWNGEGWGRSILAPLGTNFTAISAVGFTNIEIQNLEIDGRGFHDNINHIQTKLLSLAQSNNVVVFNNYLHDSPATALAMDMSIHSLASNNYIAYAGQSLPEEQIIGIGSAGIGDGTCFSSDMPHIISNNTIEFSGNHGIFIESQCASGADANSQKILITGNSVRYTDWGAGDGIGDHGGNDAIITANSVTYSKEGIQVSQGESTAFPINFDIQNNVLACNNYGALLQWTNGGGIFKNNDISCSYNTGLSAVRGVFIDPITGGTVGQLDATGNKFHEITGNPVFLSSAFFGSVDLSGSHFQNFGTVSVPKSAIFSNSSTGGQLHIHNAIVDPTTAAGTYSQSYLLQGTASTWTLVDMSNNSTPGAVTAPFLLTGMGATNTTLNGIPVGAVNLVPDSEDIGGTATWSLTGAMTSVSNAGPGGNHGFVYVGTGSGSGVNRAISQPITVTPLATYTAQVAVNGANVTTSALAGFKVFNTALTTSYATATIAATSNEPEGVQSTFTVPSGVTQVVLVLDSNNATVSSGNNLTFGNPQMFLGTISGPYAPSAPAGFANPMTTLGDTIYGGSAGAATRLAGPTAGAGTYFLSNAPTGGSAVAPTWFNSNTLAPLASPALTGAPTAPTATVGTNTTQIATTAFVLANSGGGTDYWWTFAGCTISGTPVVIGTGCSGTTTLPGAMPDASWYWQCTVDANGGLTPPSVVAWTANMTLPLPTASGSTLTYGVGAVTIGGGVSTLGTQIYCHAHHP